MLCEHRMNVAKVFHRPLHRFRQIQRIATRPLCGSHNGQREDETEKWDEAPHHFVDLVSHDSQWVGKMICESAPGL